MMSGFLLSREPISGVGVTLIPSQASHAAELRDAAEAVSTFRYFSRGPDPFDESGFVKYIESFSDDDSVRMFTVREKASGHLVGMTSFLDIRPAHRTLEIGWTWYGTAWRGGLVNPACKLLLLGLAFEGGLFDGLGAVRVQLRTDERNEQSRRAISKLGAKFEGTLRNQLVMQDGHLRATATYSIVPEEWGAVRAGLEERLRRVADAELHRE